MYEHIYIYIYIYIYYIYIPYTIYSVEELGIPY